MACDSFLAHIRTYRLIAQTRSATQAVETPVLPYGGAVTKDGGTLIAAESAEVVCTVPYDKFQHFDPSSRNNYC